MPTTEHDTPPNSKTPTTQVATARIIAHTLCQHANAGNCPCNKSGRPCTASSIWGAEAAAVMFALRKVGALWMLRDEIGQALAAEAAKQNTTVFALANEACRKWLGDDQ